MSRESIANFILSSTGRLAMTYLGIIMLMSIGFSFVFYNTSAGQLGRQLPPSAFFTSPSQNIALNPLTDRTDVQAFLRQRIDEGRSALRLRLIWVNILALVAGGAISYGLARRTLRPIEEAMEAQTQFIGDASHELKTPLTAIRASNEVALRKPKLTLPEAKNLIKQNTKDVTKLQVLSDGLLRLVNDKDTTMSLKPVSLQETIAEAMTQIVKQAQKKDITVTDQVADIKVFANKQGLTQVANILLDNAVKYSAPKTTITINSSTDAKFAFLEFIDQGIGIRAADLPHIFKRFYRADKSRTKQHYDGYGLGLSIADKLLNQQHGEILVRSTIGRGSTFIVKLPLAN